jgi:hypothetical protein
LKSLIKEAKENWYMLLILIRSPITIKRLLPMFAKPR